MDPGYFGTEQVTEEDRAYAGSHFSEVRDAIFADPYQEIWGAPDAPPLPTNGVTLSKVLRGTPPFRPPYFFVKRLQGRSIRERICVGELIAKAFGVSFIQMGYASPVSGRSLRKPRIRAISERTAVPS